MGSTRGVLKVSRAARYMSGARDAGRPLDVAVLGKSDGMRSSECGGLSQPPAARAKDGTLWFATAKGFAHTNPSQVVEPPPSGIAAQSPGLTIDRAPVATLDHIVIPPGTERRRFSIRRRALVRSGAIQFRCQAGKLRCRLDRHRRAPHAVPQAASRQIPFRRERARSRRVLERSRSRRSRWNRRRIFISAGGSMRCWLASPPD